MSHCNIDQTSHDHKRRSHPPHVHCHTSHGHSGTRHHRVCRRVTLQGTAHKNRQLECEFHNICHSTYSYRYSERLFGCRSLDRYTSLVLRWLGTGWHNQGLRSCTDIQCTMFHSKIRRERWLSTCSSPTYCKHRVQRRPRHQTVGTAKSNRCL